MASRKDQKETARQARLSAEQAVAARTAQRRRYGVIGGIVIVSAIIAVIAVVISSSSGAEHPGIQTGTTETSTYRAVASELQGIPQSGVTLGRPGAAVTIQYFGDLECPVCQAFTLGKDGGGLPQLIDGPVRHGTVRLVYRSFETATGGTNDARWYPQQIAAYAAGTQDLFWQYAELFYHEQGSEDDHYVTEAYLTGLARQIPGLDLSRWMSDRSDAALEAEVKADGKRAINDGLQGTPTLVAAGPKGEMIVSGDVPTYAEIMSAVQTVS